MTGPFPAGSATGLGSLPGTDPNEAARVVLGELAVPHVPELPARGPHADLAGRGLSLLVDLPVDLQPSGWRFVARRGRDATRARDLLRRDLDALEDAAGGTAPAVLKTQVTGPWTLATLVETTRGGRALADHGAVDDLTESLAEGIRRHLADLRGRFPGSALVLQVDEPSLPGVLAARIPTPSGLGTLRAPDPVLARDRLRTVLAAAGDAFAIVHCCAPAAPLDLLREAGARGVAVDVSQLRRQDEDALGTAVEAGLVVLLGVVPSTDGDLSDLDARIAPVKEIWRRLGLDPVRLAQQGVVTPTCGLAGASPTYARAALAAAREMGRRLHEAPE